MMKTKTISLLTVLLLSLTLTSITAASASKTWTATFAGDITGTASLTLTRGYWYGEDIDLTFVDPVPSFWTNTTGTDFSGVHSVRVETTRIQQQLEFAIYIRWPADIGGDYLLTVRGTYDLHSSPGNLVITTLDIGDLHIKYYPTPAFGTNVWTGSPNFNITIPLAH